MRDRPATEEELLGMLKKCDAADEGLGNPVKGEAAVNRLNSKIHRHSLVMGALGAKRAAGRALRIEIAAWIAAVAAVVGMFAAIASLCRAW
jgi:hypothetical protein